MLHRTTEYDVPKRSVLHSTLLDAGGGGVNDRPAETPKGDSSRISNLTRTHARTHATPAGVRLTRAHRYAYVRRILCRSCRDGLSNKSIRGWLRHPRALSVERKGNSDRGVLRYSAFSSRILRYWIESRSERVCANFYGSFPLHFNWAINQRI